MAGSGEGLLHLCCAGGAGGGRWCSSRGLRATLQRSQILGSGSCRDIIPGLHAGDREAVLEDRRCQVRSEGMSPFLSSNPECRYVASSSKDGSVRVWDTAAGRCERILTGHTQSVTCLRWGGDGLLYSASQDRTIKVWRAHDVRAGRGPKPAWGNLGPGRLTTVSWVVGEVLRERGSYGLVLHYSGGSRTP